MIMAPSYSATVLECLKPVSEGSTGFDSPTIRAEITKREKEIANLVTQVAGQKKGSVRDQVQGLRRRVKEGLGDVRQLLTEKARELFPSSPRTRALHRLDYTPTQR